MLNYGQGEHIKSRMLTFTGVDFDSPFIGPSQPKRSSYSDTRIAPIEEARIAVSSENIEIWV